MVVKRSDLAWISVSDIAKAKKFFTEVVGLKVCCDTPEYGWLELQAPEGGALLGVGQHNPKHGKEVMPGDNAIVTFTVADIVATKAEFEKQGVKLLGEIVEVPGHVKMLFFTDNDGNKFQIVQLLEAEIKNKQSCC